MASVGSSDFEPMFPHPRKPEGSRNIQQRKSKVRRASLKVRQDPDFVSGDDIDDDEEYQDVGSFSIGGKRHQHPHGNGVDSLDMDDSTRTTDDSTAFLSAEVLSLQNFECPLCSLALSNGDDLEQHVAVHAGEKESFECGVCGKVCYEVTTFGKHLRQHTGERPFKCDICGKSFRERCSLTRHRRTHTGEKPFVCEVCDKAFADIGSYGRHRKTHMGNRAKVHQCPEDGCTKSFIDKSSLKRHLKIHTGERPYQCQICLRSFTESGSFKRHQRIHTGEKRFSCKRCGRPFAEKASLIRHEKNVSCQAAANRDIASPKSLDPDSASDLDPGTLSSHESPYLLSNFLKAAAGRGVSLENVSNSSRTARGVMNEGSRAKVNNNDSHNSTHSMMSDDGDGSIDTLDYSNNNSSKSSNMNPISPIAPSAQSSGGRFGAERVNEKLVHDSSSKNNSTDSIADLENNNNIMPTLLPYGDTSELHGDNKSISSKTNIPSGNNSQADVARNTPSPAMPQLERMEPGPTSPLIPVLEREDGLIPAAFPQAKTSVASLQPQSNPSTDVGPKDSYMCFECGDAISDDDDNTNSSESSRTEGNKPRRCRMCREEATGYTNEESSPAVSEDSSSQRARHRNSCHECGKSFSDFSKLKRHMKIHTGIKDFKCHACGKAFIEASSLRRHESVHSAVKPYTCPCGKGFTDSSGLKKHSVKCKGQFEGEGHAEAKDKERLKVSENLKVKRDVEMRDDVQMEVSKDIDEHSGKGVRGHFPDSNLEAVRETFPESTALWKSFSHSLSDKATTSSGGAIDLTLKRENTDSVSHHKKTDPVSCQKKTDPHSHKNMDSVKPPLPLALPEFMQGYRSDMLYICTECGQSCEDARSFGRHLFTHRKLSGMNGFPALGGAGSPVSCVACGKMFVSAQYLEQHLQNHKSCASAYLSLSSALIQTTSTVSSLASGRSSVSSAVSSGSWSAAASSLVTSHPFVQSTSSPKERMENVSPTSAYTPDRAHSPSFINEVASSQGDSSKSSSPLPESVSGGQNCCTVCGKTFADLGSLKRHARLHTGQQQHPCDNCGKVYGDQGSLKRHLQKGCSPWSVTGEVKQREMPAEDGARDANFLCTQCKKVFPSAEALTMHEKQHRVTPELRCSTCRKSFMDTDSLDHHSCPRTKTRQFLCDICQKGFADNGSLVKHRARGCYPVSTAHLGADKLPCVDCGKVFSDQSNFDLHMSTHKGVKPYSCSQCGKSFTEACSLKRHTRLHTGQNLCRCLHCGRTFLENSGLKKHLERKSCMRVKKVVKSFLYPCGACSKVFTKRYILMRHMKTHLGLRPFTCDKCDKSFTESSSLKRHYRLHTGEKPFGCSCGKMFSDAGVLKKHKQRCPFSGDRDVRRSVFNRSSPSDSNPVSTDAFGDPPSTISHTYRPMDLTCHSAGTSQSLSAHQSRFQHHRDCWRCGKKFANFAALQQHKKAVHSRLWAFKCVKCWRKFTHLPYLRAHKHCHQKGPHVPAAKV